MSKEPRNEWQDPEERRLDIRALLDDDDRLEERESRAEDTRRYLRERPSGELPPNEKRQEVG